MKTEPIYKKVGRKYVPVRGYWLEDARADSMVVGTCRLVYCYADGARRYEYDVKPDTAAFMAAALVAKVAMENAIREASAMRPSGNLSRYTKKELACIEQFRKDMHGLNPTHWQGAPAHEVADAAIKAVQEFKP